MRRFGLLAAVLLSLVGFLSFGRTQPVFAADNGVNIYLFWGEGCPHCAKAKPFLESLDESSDFVNLYKYEIYYNYQNQVYLQQVASVLGIDSSGVPLMIIGDQEFVGYSSSYDGPIKDRVDYCVQNGCSDSVANIVGATEAAKNENSSIAAEESTASFSGVIDLPIVGQLDVADFSLPVLTFVIAALDGFNPCAMWTLMFLIALLLGMNDRKKMWGLGSAFIATSAIVYFMFMSAWLNVFLFIGYVTWVKFLIGLVALGAGGYYLYDYCQNRSGSCRISGSDRRQKVFGKIRRIAENKSFWIALGGIVALAFAVNLVELVCSAGLPAVYTSILSSSDLNTTQYYMYLLFYILVFMADDLLVFLVAMLTLKMVGLDSKYARVSHLIGGVLMLVLGILLIFAPELLMFG